MPKPSLLSFAELAQHTYRLDGESETPEGWQVLATQTLPIGSVIKKIRSTPKIAKVGGIFQRSTTASGAGAGAGATVERDETTVTEELSTRLVAYYNPIDNQIVVAFRGTSFTEPADLVADLEIIVKIEPSRVENALRFVKEIRETSKSWAFWHAHRMFSRCQWRAPEIFLTGHSLGATIAGRLTLITGFYSVIFDSPGCDDRGSTRTYRYADRITSVLSMPNLINCANRHVGELLHIPAQRLGGERKLAIVETAKPWVEAGISALLSYYGITTPPIARTAYDTVSAKTSHIMHTLLTHSIDGFVEYLRGPNPINSVVSWPSITEFLSSADPKSVKPGLATSAHATAAAPG